MNLAKVEKHYTNLTVDERARMMIAARMRDDDTEVKKLVASAERRQFTIRANYESDICEAWHRAHLMLISLSADSHIKELKCAMYCYSMVAEDEDDFDDELADRVLNIQLSHRQARKINLAAFMDWIEEHDLPFEKDLLVACGIELSLLDNEDRDEIKNYDNYSEIYSLFTNVWDNR